MTGGPPRDWLVSPAFDLLFLANLGWLLALVPGYVAAEGTVHIEFWQIYFLTTPHRWITLLLVAADPDRRAGRDRARGASSSPRATSSATPRP